MCKPEDCNFIERETPLQVLSCEFCNIFQNNHFVKHLLLLVNQNWHRNCMFITEINVLRKSFTFWLTCISPKKSRSLFSYQSSVSLLHFFFAGGKVGALNIYSKNFLLLLYKNFNFLIITFSFTLFLLSQFYKISNRYSFWYLNYAASPFVTNYTPWNFLLLPIISLSWLCTLPHYLLTKWNRLLYQHFPGSSWTISWMFINIPQNLC